MVLTIDPRFPLVWRSPDSVQIGVDEPLAVLTDVSAATERLLAVLVRGISRSGLSMIAKDAGIGESDVETLLSRLGDALLIPAVEPARALSHVVVDGAGPTADRIAGALREWQVSVDRGPDTSPTSSSSTPVDLAIIVAHYAIAPRRYGMWLRRDIPHLPVVFSDLTIRIGPLVEPGIGPCLYCIDSQRTDFDDAWPAIAAQLVVKFAPTETSVLSGEVAVRVARIVAVRLATGVNALARASLIVDAQTGEVSSLEWLPHPECACRSLSENVSVLVPPAVRTGSAGPGLPTRGSAVVSRE